MIQSKLSVTQHSLSLPLKAPKAHVRLLSTSSRVLRSIALTSSTSPPNSGKSACSSAALTSRAGLNASRAVARQARVERVDSRSGEREERRVETKRRSV